MKGFTKATVVFGEHAQHDQKSHGRRGGRGGRLGSIAKRMRGVGRRTGERISAGRRKPLMKSTSEALKDLKGDGGKVRKVLSRQEPRMARQVFSAALTDENLHSLEGLLPGSWATDAGHRDYSRHAGKYHPSGWVAGALSGGLGSRDKGKLKGALTKLRKQTPDYFDDLEWDLFDSL